MIIQRLDDIRWIFDVVIEPQLVKALCASNIRIKNLKLTNFLRRVSAQCIILLSLPGYARWICSLKYLHTLTPRTYTLLSFSAGTKYIKFKTDLETKRKYVKRVTNVRTFHEIHLVR